MAKYAIIVGDMVDNLIVIDPADVPAYVADTGADMMDAAPLGLAIGDLRVGDNWTRNVDGEQVILPLQADEIDALLDEMEGAIGND